MPSSSNAFVPRIFLIDSIRRLRRPRPRQPSLDFSLTGLIYCSLMMFMGLAAMNTQANLLFGVFGLMIGILIISGLVSRIMLKKLQIRRNLSQRAVVGEPLTVYYEITNNKRYWPSLSVSLVELDAAEGFVTSPQCYVLHAARKMTATVPVELLPKHRGIYELDHFQIGTSFPFGFIKRAAVDRHKDKLCIFPALAEVDRRVIAMCRSADNTGELVRPRAGGVDEFYGLREYRPGDNPRHIYWRRTARTGVLVTKEMMRVSPPRLVLLVDTYLPEPTVQSLALVERVIAMAASLASAVLEQELAVGICTWSGKPITITPARGKQHREELLTLLACLSGNTSVDVAQLVTQIGGMIRSGTSLVILTAQKLTMPLPEIARGGVVVLSASSDNDRAYFHFRPEVRFGDENKIDTATMSRI